jgi:beta-lactamase superfamily II metal-dependent hydrolase
MARRFALLAWLLVWSVPRLAIAQFQPSGLLEIHYINVGQGGSTLIIGPDGTRILYDFGKVSGHRDIVPYLRDQVGLAAQDGIHFTIVSHRDTDHYVGYRKVIEAGYDVLVANYDPGSPKRSSTIDRDWLTPAASTTAGPVQPIPVGLPIALGDGAVAIVMAANGRVYGDPTPVEVENENDRSVSLFISYGNFQYILDGDLGGGKEDCSDHDTDQVNVQTRVAESLLALGLMSRDHGVDVLHVAHHGSESSTPSSYFNLMRPEVGLISVGLNQGSFLHPREDVVDGILLAGPMRDASECVFTAPPLLELLQTEDGKAGSSTTGRTSFSGKTVGNIKLVTDGRTQYTITGDNMVHEGSDVASSQPYRRVFTLDESQDGG